MGTAACVTEDARKWRAEGVDGHLRLVPCAGEKGAARRDVVGMHFEGDWKMVLTTLRGGCFGGQV